MMRWSVLAFGVLALAALVLLAAGLQGTAFHAGKPWPTVLAMSHRAGGEAPAFPGNWLAQLLRVLLLLSVAMFIFSLFSRKLRRHLLHLLVALGLLLLAWYSLRLLLKGEEKPVLPPQGAAAGSAWAESEGAMERVHAPTWAVYVGALVLGALLALWLTPRLMARMQRVRQTRAIEELAREAQWELAHGAPVNDVVLRCWLRMVEILSRRSGARDQPQLTPREFAQTLAKLGFRDEAISLLTQVFEEVRYGHKDSESRRELALSALSALEKAYG